MGSAKNTGTAARKARIEEMRRAEQARERRTRIVKIAASVVVVAGLVVGGVAVVHAQSGGKGSSAGDAKGGSGHFVTGKDGVKTWKGTLGRTHVSGTVNYPMRPPVGGNHNPVWLNCNGDVYPKAVKDENAVHAMEHGAVWVTYNAKASAADVKALAAKVKQTPYSLMSPYANQKDPIMLSAWGHQRTVTSATDPNVNKFFAEFVQGSQTPEPGAACTGGLSQ